ncbi:FixH family protein [Roseomonas sp. SSH11]|uniref:FixH family protein n=1 Tax=Pararoseomonas baculiformis TaxID=2820812 RepID=A0ABS4AJC5_9PROT|nr:FixH family protein [Pararoseomonas baculiformis]MBP0447135.1 FixH family protein [Pararoseomonas baculiformis]
MTAPATLMAPSPRRGRWIPWAFVGAFAVVIGVNGVLITAAISTYSGTTTAGSYDRGRSYGAVLAEAARQQALGWQGRITREGGAVRLSLHQADGIPLPADAVVNGTLQRPLERASVPLDFTPAAPGSWRAAAGIPAPGAWEAVLTVTRGTDRLELRERLVFP